MTDRHAAALKALTTRRINEAWAAAHAAETQSKKELRRYCDKKGWKIAFFEGKTGAPRTGIIDAVAFRIAHGKADKLELRLIQLKGGKAGVTGREIRRLKDAATGVSVSWLIAAFDGQALQLVPDDL